MRSGGWLIMNGEEVAETITCKHCNNVVIVAPRNQTPNTAYCRLCDGHICLHCEPLPCVPFEKKIKELEAKTVRANQLKNLGII